MPGLVFACALVLIGVVKAGADVKTALVIGIDTYIFGPDLKTPVADAKAVSQRLAEIGYDVHVAFNPTQPELLHVLAKFRIESVKATEVKVYIAAHGVQWQGESYILARDTPFAESVSLISRSVPVSLILAAISDKVRNKIVLIDACREIPTAQSTLDQHPILARQRQTAPFAGSFVLYSAQPGAPAWDGAATHSPFATAVLETLETRMAIDSFARQVRTRVVAMTDGTQVPWSVSSLLTDVMVGGA